MENNKNFDSCIPVERNGEITVFLEIHLRRWPVSNSPRTTMLKEESVETHVAGNPRTQRTGNVFWHRQETLSSCLYSSGDVTHRDTHS